MRSGHPTVAAFHTNFVRLISELGGRPTFNGNPNEVPNPVPFFTEDHRERAYDREAVQRFHQALVAVDRVFNQFRTSFLGKSSPVHLFWGSFDLAVTRFSGRRAPLHPGGIPSLPNDVAQEAYDREVSSAGFLAWRWRHRLSRILCLRLSGADWLPGGVSSVRGLQSGMRTYLSLFCPTMPFNLPPMPTRCWRRFSSRAYEAAADLGGWDRDLLECVQGRPRQVRQPGRKVAADYRLMDQ